jgi:predicted RNase H-like nuclease (RuvC/YqgF family)
LEDEEMNIYKPTGEKLEPWPLMVRQLERENKELKKEIERLKQTIQELKKSD